MPRDAGLDDITTATEIIAVIMPNIDGIRTEDWTQWQTSVDKIEASTGYDFLNAIPNNIETVLEQ